MRVLRERRAWLALAATSIAFALLLDGIGLPAAWLLAPMAVAVVAAVCAGVELRVPGWLSVAAQALIGCLIAHAITPGIFATLLRDWPLFLATTTATIVMSALLGYLLARWRVVPGTVAIWGSTPGGATAMVIMAEAWGADARLVAVMVYLRVVMVAMLASCVALAFARYSVPLTHASPLAVHPEALLLTLAVAGAGIVIGRLLKLPAGALLAAMAIGAALNLGGIAQISPPRLLLLPAYIVIRQPITI